MLGDASYSIYLIHIWILLRISDVRFPWMKQINGDLLIWILVVICAAGGLLLYHFVEKPLLRFLQRKLLVKRTTNGPLATAPL